jgi:hypothetical protein
MARLAEEHSKLFRRVENFLVSHPTLASLGPDPLVRQLLAAKGLAAEDAVVLRALAGGRLITVICAPRRVWRDNYGKAALLEVRQEALDYGCRCILVPQGWAKAPVRAAVARSIALSRRIQFSDRQFGALLEYLNSVKVSTLAEAAQHIPDHDDPWSVVLQLCAQGLVAIDRSQPIAPESWVASRTSRITRAQRMF